MLFSFTGTFFFLIFQLLSQSGTVHFRHLEAVFKTPILPFLKMQRPILGLIGFPNLDGRFCFSDVFSYQGFRKEESFLLLLFITFTIALSYLPWVIGIIPACRHCLPPPPAAFHHACIMPFMYTLPCLTCR